MNISSPIIKLYETNILNIKYFVNNLTEQDWNLWDLRQKKFDVHSNTKSYSLIWAEEHDENTYHVFLKNRTSTINQILIPEVNKLEDFYDGTCINLMFAKLPANKNIHPHGDASNLLLNVHRIHLPILTNQNVDFYIDDNRYNLKEGTFYEINNSLTHSVENNSFSDRIHLIIDILPRSKNIKLKYICE